MARPDRATEVVELDTGWRARRWTEHVTATTAEVVASYTTGGVSGGAAVTRRPVGSGSAWYLASDLEAEGLGELVDRLLDEAGISPAAATSPGVEAVRRASDEGSWLFVLNHAESEGWAEVTGGLEVGAALGITTYRAGDSVATLLARADAEMYADKAGTGPGRASRRQPRGDWVGTRVDRVPGLA